MKDGYPEDKELDMIKTWDIHYVFDLVDFIESIWWMDDWGMNKKWGVDKYGHGRHVLYLELHTGGWSGNEEIIEALLSNMMVKVMGYIQWRIGGHYWFEFTAESFGYKTSHEFCKEKGFTRQYLFKAKNKFEWIHISKKKRLVREIKPITNERLKRKID